MRVFESVREWREFRRSGEVAGRSIGFVPTMGALHEGHLSLLQRARRENELVVLSIFVNPTQFNDPGDLKAYPRTLERDLERAREAGVDAVLCPEFAELYPDAYRYKLSEASLSQLLCGRHRPGHFDGVLTVVMKLFMLVRADRAYFGEKDYQQYLLVKGMAEAFFLETGVVPCQTVRESDGLAMSSRNTLLSPEARGLAKTFPGELSSGKSPDQVAAALLEQGFEVDYIEEREGRRFGAVRIGGVRLIDNVRA